MPSPTQCRGADSERQAQALLCGQGLQLVARNVRWRGGEIDLILRDGERLVFVEVRQRSRADWGGAAASVGNAKQRRIILTAQWWLSRHFQNQDWPECRFDVVAIDQDRLQWLQDAFSG